MRKSIVALTIAVVMLIAIGMSFAVSAEGEKVKLKLYLMPQDDAQEADWTLYDHEKNSVEAKYPDIEFEWTRLAPGTDYRQQYDTLLMAGDGPTLARQFPYVDIQTRLANGTIAEITEYVVNWDLKNQGLVNTTFDQAISTPDGKWYAVPFAPYVTGIAYNKAVIREAGGEPDHLPTTWSEFADLASQYTDKDEPRFGYLLLGSDYNAWTFTPWVWSAGGEMVRQNADGSWAIAFNEEPGVNAAMYMNELIWARNATQKDILESYDDYQNHFKAGQAAFGWGSPPDFTVEQLEKFDQVQDDIGVFPLPGKDEGGTPVAFAGGEVWTMSPLASKEQRDAAWDVLTYLSYDEEFLIEHWKLEDSLGQLNAKPSVRTDLVETKYALASKWPAHWAKELADAMAVAKPEPYCPNWNDLKNEIVIPLQTIYLKEGITFDEAKALLDDCAERLYEMYPETFKKPV
ncbi:MAG: extracellular solute-binding protein [Oscillospiraceae bacterium]|jgi:ABC-type glycerol-3-phosphate transport system substrate-binding protein|nr:extracellular solute-binding protein [Oscillospiraceae bacterium]